MICPATQAIASAFDEHGMHYSIQEDEDGSGSYISLSLECDNVTFRALFISSGDDTNVAMRIYKLLKYPPERTGDILSVACDVNSDFRFVKFCVDTKTNTVDVEYDFAREMENIGEAAYELLQRAGDIIDQAYPKFMSSIYGSSKEGV